jgi:DNA/RNA endonuclease YhcR with UshA esterase domain
MSRSLRGLGLLTLLALIMNMGVAHAQTASEAAKPTTTPRYDISKEVTLNAMVKSVPSKSAFGRTNSGFVLQTTSGEVRGSLTPFVLNGKGALTIAPGANVQVTGVMLTMKNNEQLFVIRIITVGGRTYAIRNERGFPLENPGQNATQSKGAQL